MASRFYKTTPKVPTSRNQDLTLLVTSGILLLRPHPAVSCWQVELHNCSLGLKVTETNAKVAATYREIYRL